MFQRPLALAEATICALNDLATRLTSVSSVALSHVHEIRQRTRAPSEGSRPMEFPPSGPDLEVVAGGMGWIVREVTRPATVESWGATCLNMEYIELRNSMSFLKVLVMYDCLHGDLASVYGTQMHMTYLRPLGWN